MIAPFLRTTLAAFLVLSATAADACRMRPQPYSRQSAERIAADGKGFAFRGKVLERFRYCRDVNAPQDPSRNVCYYDLKIEVAESFGREFKGIVLYKNNAKGLGGNRHHTMWEACGYIPAVGTEEYFLIGDRDADSVSMLEDGN